MKVSQKRTNYTAITPISHKMQQLILQQLLLPVWIFSRCFFLKIMDLKFELKIIQKNRKDIWLKKAKTFPTIN
jgi:hypothetical protein